MSESTDYLYDGTPAEHSINELPLDEIEENMLRGLQFIIVGLRQLQYMSESGQEHELYEEEETCSIPEKDQIYDNDEQLGKIFTRGTEKQELAKIRLSRTLIAARNCQIMLQPIDFEVDATSSKRFGAHETLRTLVSTLDKND